MLQVDRFEDLQIGRFVSFWLSKCLLNNEVEGRFTLTGFGKTNLSLEINFWSQTLKKLEILVSTFLEVSLIQNDLL